MSALGSDTVSEPDPVGWMTRYLAAKRDIPGWFSDEDLRLFAAINRLQTAAGVQGDLLEVGGYLAQSAIALGYMRNQGETLVVVDPWDSEVSDAENAKEQELLYPSVNLQLFKSNFQRFHSQLPDIRRGTSSQRLPELETARYRFIHIDGSHEWEQVKFDVEQVLRLLAPNGIVAFDDLDAPGVAAAVWPECSRGSLIPLATTRKLYAATGLMSATTAETLSDAIGDEPGLEVVARHQIFGRPVSAVGAPRSAPLWATRFVPPPLLERVSRSYFGSWIIRARAARLSRRPGSGTGAHS